MRGQIQQIFIFVFLLLPFQNAQCSDVLVFGNGMYNSPEKAALSLYELKDSLENNPISPQVFEESYLVYNQNERWWTQVWQVIKQKLGEKPKLDENEEDFLVDKYFDGVKKINLSDLDDGVNDEDLQRHLDFYRKIFSENKRVIAVTHSQGCFYANRAFSVLSAEISDLGQRFKNVQVASPSAFVSAPGIWITHDKDLVINSVRSITSALPANYPGPDFRWGDVLRHSFVTNYLQHEPTKFAILQSIIDFRNDHSVQ